MQRYNQYIFLLLFLFASIVVGAQGRHYHHKLKQHRSVVPVVTQQKVLDRMLEGMPLPGYPDTTKPFICYYPVYKMPEFRGDIQAYLNANFHYTDAIKKDGTAGRVVVQFTVETDGRVDSAKIVRSLSPAADAEALRVVRKMPRWTPQIQNGKAVATYYTLPFLIDK